MSRGMRRFLVMAAAAGIIGTVALPASAQHYYSGGHYDYHPGHYDRHNGHYDYHPGHYDYHSGHHHYGGTSYVYPSQGYITPRTYVQPSVVVSPYSGSTHPYDHGRGSVRTARKIAFGGFSHIDDLAMTLESQANTLCLELWYNYQHNPGFNQTYREAYEILTTAKYIHGLEHSGNRAKMSEAVRELDGLFHHVEGDVARWTGHHHRHLGHGGLTTKLEAVEQTLHHLMDDVGIRPASAASEQAPPAGGPIAPPVTRSIQQQLSH